MILIFKTLEGFAVCRKIKKIRAMCRKSTHGLKKIEPCSTFFIFPWHMAPREVCRSSKCEVSCTRAKFKRNLHQCILVQSCVISYFVCAFCATVKFIYFSKHDKHTSSAILVSTCPLNLNFGFIRLIRYVCVPLILVGQVFLIFMLLSHS